MEKFRQILFFINTKRKLCRRWEDPVWKKLVYSKWISVARYLIHLLSAYKSEWDCTSQRKWLPRVRWLVLQCCIPMNVALCRRWKKLLFFVQAHVFSTRTRLPTLPFLPLEQCHPKLVILDIDLMCVSVHIYCFPFSILRKRKAIGMNVDMHQAKTPRNKNLRWYSNRMNRAIFIYLY